MYSSPPLIPALNKLWRLQLTLAGAIAVAAASLAAFAATPAPAALIATNVCNDATLSQPFSRWADSGNYELIPGGTFESATTGWTLTGGAARVSGSEPYAISGSTGAYSLALPAGASAQTPYTCVNAAYPTFRFFARTEGTLATLLAQVVYKTQLGTIALPLGVVALSREWHPTLPMLTGSVVTGILSNGTAQASLRFTALTGSARIDDIYVDPRMR